jgi:hypothetical protein
MKTLSLALVLSVLLSTAACAVPPLVDRPWTTDDLRLLQPSREGIPASADLLAVYTRPAGSDVQIRLDFLDLALSPDQDIYIALETKTGGSNGVLLSPSPSKAAEAADLTPTALPWNVLLVLPASGSPQAFTPGASGPSASILPRVVRDPWLDTVTVSLNSYTIAQPFRLQIFVTAACTAGAGPCSLPALDQTAVISSAAQPPLAHASLLMAFWDSFPAYTPALALRRWDGAHAGPNGGRHGLNLLLTAAQQFFIPVALLDLKTPAGLAALDLIGATKRLRGMSDAGLLILPDVAYGDPPDVSLGYSRRAAAGFGLPASQFVYAASAQPQPGYLAQFVPLADASHLSRRGATRLIPLPPADAVQATEAGPALDVRLGLLAAALSGDPSRLVVLGGDLPRSTWGNADAVAASFAWFAAHPWIRPLYGADLLTLPPGTKNSAPQSGESRPAAFPVYDGNGNQIPFSQSDLIDALVHASQNPITDLAWQTYFSLTAPSADDRLQSLRAQYDPDVLSLLSASRWAQGQSPSVKGCETFTGNGLEVCALANRYFLAFFKGKDARLEFLFHRDRQGLHQIVGPSSQFTVGLSDQSLWHPEFGPAADPSVIQGAFDESPPADINRYSAGAATFTASGDGFSKTYRLTDSGLEVSYHLTVPLSTRLPLAVDPQAFYFGPTSYTGTLSPGSWTWGLANGIRVQVRSDAALTASGFSASLPFLSQPEDPDQDYPPGHYLPFPLSVVSLSAEQDFSVRISIK